MQGSQATDNATTRGVRVAGDARVNDGVRLGKYRALIVGINEYENSGIWAPLKAARKDAEVLHAVLTQHYGFEAADVNVLLDEQATYNAVRGALQKLQSESGPDDMVLIYFAGHGSYEGHDR